MARECLVFRHRDDPEAGIQVPKGTVLPGEAPELAALREAYEETGLRGLVVLRALAVDLRMQPDGSVHERHFFALAAPAATPDTWEHTVSGEGADTGLVFCCFWARNAAGVNLWPTVGDYLHLAHETPGRQLP